MAQVVHSKHRQRKLLARRNLYNRTLPFVTPPDLHREAVYIPTQDAFWEIQDFHNKAQLAMYGKLLHRSQAKNSRSGTKSYKTKYHRLRRRHSAAITRAYMIGDEDKAESLPNQDYFRGSIAWDLW